MESFNGHFREACQDQHCFLTLEEARRIIEPRRIEYNTVRPHRGLNQQVPAAFCAALWRYRTTGP